jgi:hypothetical protein
MSPLPSLADFRAQGRLVELRGHRIFVSEYGSGPPDPVSPRLSHFKLRLRAARAAAGPSSGG